MPYQLGATRPNWAAIKQNFNDRLNLNAQDLPIESDEISQTQGIDQTININHASISDPQVNLLDMDVPEVNDAQTNSSQPSFDSPFLTPSIQTVSPGHTLCVNLATDPDITKKLDLISQTVLQMQTDIATALHLLNERVNTLQL